MNKFAPVPPSGNKDDSLRNYMIEEYVEEYQEGRMTRREVLKRLGGLFGSAAPSVKVECTVVRIGPQFITSLPTCPIELEGKVTSMSLRAKHQQRAPPRNNMEEICLCQSTCQNRGGLCGGNFRIDLPERGRW